MAQLIAATNKMEVDNHLQQVSQTIVTMREQINVLENWRAPLDEAYLTGLGYDTQQIAEMTSFINIAAAWVDQIGAGGTMSENDGLVFARTLTALYGLGSITGLATVPPPPEA
jgi:hypothetical protein